MQIQEIIDSAIGDIGTGLFNTLIGLIEGGIKNFFNLFFSRGISLRNVLKVLHLTFIDFEKVALQPYDGYFIFFVTPKFNLEQA